MQTNINNVSCFLHKPTTILMSVHNPLLLLISSQFNLIDKVHSKIIIIIIQKTYSMWKGRQAAAKRKKHAKNRANST